MRVWNYNRSNRNQYVKLGKLHSTIFEATILFRHQVLFGVDFFTCLFSWIVYRLQHVELAQIPAPLPSLRHLGIVITGNQLGIRQKRTGTCWDKLRELAIICNYNIYYNNLSGCSTILGFHRWCMFFPAPKVVEFQKPAAKLLDGKCNSISITGPAIDAFSTSQYGVRIA